MTFWDIRKRPIQPTGKRSAASPSWNGSLQVKRTEGGTESTRSEWNVLISGLILQEWYKPNKAQHKLALLVLDLIAK